MWHHARKALADFPSAVCRRTLRVYTKPDETVPGTARGAGAAGARLFKESDS